MRRAFRVSAAALAAIVLLTACTQQKKAKYVFFFIGDGMSFSSVSAAEAYKAQKAGDPYGQAALNFTSFPVMGMATTFSANSPITCSAAAGTALSTGFKTKNGMISMAPDTTRLTSITYKIHDAGYKVGVVSDCGINHPTPAVFYAATDNRGNYYEIAKQLAGSGFEFFGGSGFLYAYGRGDEQEYVGIFAKEAGYTFARGLKEFEEKKCDKIIFTRENDFDAPLPYRFCRKDNDIRLNDAVRCAIEVLEKDSKGFFLMTEGGLMDFAEHSNDAINTVTEILNLDESIEVALEFYGRHPDETLIIVTADHECGGITLGSANKKILDFSVFDDITENFNSSVIENSKGAKELQGERSELAHIGWTTHSHTGGAVPVFAIGCCSETFAGRQDNTDIPKKICAAMGVKF